MNAQSMTLVLLFGLAVALAVVAWLAWSQGRRSKAQRKAWGERQAQLEQRLAEQRAATDRAEAARARAEDDLRASEQRYVVALRGAQDGLWEWDIGSGTVLLSPRWKAMLGFAADELSDDLAGWRSRVHADDRPALEQALADHLAQSDALGDSRFDHEMRLVHKDGSVRWVLSRAVAIRRASGAPYRMVGLDTDVTRLKRVLTVLDAVADGTAGALGEKFFPAMVQHFARALDVDCAFVTECADYPTTRLRTLAFWSADGMQKNFEYALAGTPCEGVVLGRQPCFHRDGLAQIFPVDAGYAAYLGMPIIASDGRVLGHLAFLNSVPLGDEMLIDSVYRIFLARAAAELERIQALAKLDKARPTGVPSTT